ncbi:MAG: hypothetical protein JXJ17_14725 [Anaerolineae bacterium]|nr:hypothetical protein [Anaerolineae bacterium]
MTQKTILKGRLNGAQRTRLKSLLDMMYRPAELAEVVNFKVRQVYRVYVPLGCPNKRDEHNHLWINGKAFREWYYETYLRTQLKADEAYCLTCLRGRKIIDGQEKIKNGLIYIQSNCPECGRVLTRIVGSERCRRDQS